MSKTPQTSFLMLEAKHINSSATTKSSSIEVLKRWCILWFFQFQIHGNGRMKGIT
jgi:hypothetical protein